MNNSHISSRSHSPQNWKRGGWNKKRRRLEISGSSGGKRKFGIKAEWWPKIIKYGIGLAILGLIVIFALFAWVSKDLPDPSGVIDRQVVESTRIFDRTGERLLFEVHGDIKRTNVELEDIPQHLKDATIVTEDRNFYQHRGFSITGIIRAALQEVLTGGSHSQGGSTITQQFVKNAILTREKTYTRKIKELILAYQIEKRFTKDEILKLYFNEIPYGSVAYGAQAASQTYFGKNVQDITLGEAAILAALPQAPTTLSPYGANTDRLFARQHFILDAMVSEGFATAEQAEAAKAEEIEFKPRTENIIAPHFVMYVRELLAEEFGESFVEQEGLEVITTLDMDKQEIAEKVIAEQAEINETDYNAGNASLVSIDPKTGEVLAMVGSRDYFDTDNDGNVNVSLRPRQPGSSFKPIVYAASFLAGYNPETILFDVETIFKTETGEDYTPRNYDLSENGPVTLRKALQGSLNVPAVKLIYLTGIDRVLDLADALGYKTLYDRSRFGLSLVLGGGEVRLLEHVAAFGAFAQDGIKHDTRAILEVRDKQGNLVKEYKDQSERVIDKQAARLLSDVLSDNNARAYVFGLANPLTLPGRPAAAKTGTTNDYRDAWTIGYTPNLVTGVWVGNNDNSAMKRGAAGGVVAAPIWQGYMTEAIADYDIEHFAVPVDAKAGKPILDGEMAAEIKVNIDSVSGKLATEHTPPWAIEERVFREVHNILHYIEKTNPKGNPPSDPTLDPHYANWEEPVQIWAEEQGYAMEAPPTEYDDVHFGNSGGPSLNILAPQEFEKISDTTMRVETAVSGREGVKEVRYYFDNQLIGTLTRPPYEINYDVSIYPNGFHKLTVVALDPLLNGTTKTIDVNLALDIPRPRVIFQSISDGGTVAANQFPVTINTTVQVPNKISKINLYAENTETKAKIPIGFVTSPGNTANFTWDAAPQAGSYYIYASMLDRQGRQVDSDGITINVTE